MPKTGFVEGGFSSGGGAGAAASTTTSPALPGGTTALGNMSILNHEFSVGGFLTSEGGTTPVFGSAVPTADLGYFVPFWVPDAILVKTLWVQNGATAAGTTIMALWTLGASGNFTKVVETSAAQAGTTAVQVFDIADTTLTAGGAYYIMVGNNNATSTFRRTTPNITLQALAGIFQSGISEGVPLTSPKALANPATTYVPLMGISTNASF